MGDLIHNFEVFKNLGFDNSNQWIFYDERFEKFFGFFVTKIADVNVLTECESLEGDELQPYNVPQRRTHLLQLERDNPGLMSCTEQRAEYLSEQIFMVEQRMNSYSALLEEMRSTRKDINYCLSDVEEQINTLLNKEIELKNLCQKKSKQLEELQRENCKLFSEATKCFTKIQSPPLFVHQLPLDQYLHKCDSFMQYFTLHMKEIFIVQEYIELGNNSLDTDEVTAKLQNMEKSIEHYTLEYLKENAKVQATQSLIDLLDLAKIHVLSIPDMERETQELELLNEHHLKIAYETMVNDLVAHVQHRTQQHFELILYENTKQKLERAIKRQESDRRLTKIISYALSNAELIWITVQLDLERIRNRFDNTKNWNHASLICSRRIRSMQNVCDVTGPSAVFLEKISEELSQHLHQKVRCDPKLCLYEYEKFCRLVAYAMHSNLIKKHYTLILEKLNELNNLESVLKPLVYDSPIESPMFEHVRHLRSIFNARLRQQKIDNALRQLRTQFQQNITERIDKDKLWRYSQLLWIWFLTEPKRVFMAIEEVKKAAAQVPTLTGIKSLGGIKRK